MALVTSENLAALPSLAAYPPEELDVLLTVARARDVAAQEVLCKEGEAGRSCFLVVSGAFDITKLGTEGALATLGAGTFVGQMALVDRSPRSATVTARGASCVLEFGREPFERLLAARSPLALRFQEQIAIAGIRQLRQATVRLVEALGKEQETLGSFSQKPSSREPGSGRDEMLRYIQAASSEWDMDLASIEVVRTEGDISPAEAAARRRARG